MAISPQTVKVLLKALKLIGKFGPPHTGHGRQGGQSDKSSQKGPIGAKDS